MFGLDIDETIAATVELWMQLLLKHCGNPENLTVKEMVEKYRYTQNVPYFQNLDANRYLMEQISKNSIQEAIPVIAGAVDAVNRIHSTLPIDAYMTNRPESVRNGTLKWLKKHGFPDAQVIMRPNYVKKADELKWKAGIIMQNDVQILIDDNAGLLPFMDGFRGTFFLYDPPDDYVKQNFVVECRDWDEVENAVIARFIKN